MRTTTMAVLMVAAITAVTSVADGAARAQTKSSDALLEWPLPVAEQAYSRIDGTRPELMRIAVAAFKQFGVPLLAEPNPRPPAGDLGRLYRFTPGVATSEFFHYFHTDRESPDTVPWTGLQATTRAYAKIVDEVNTQALGVFQRPEEPVPTR